MVQARQFPASLDSSAGVWFMLGFVYPLILVLILCPNMSAQRRMGMMESRHLHTVDRPEGRDSSRIGCVLPFGPYLAETKGAVTSRSSDGQEDVPGPTSGPLSDPTTSDKLLWLGAAGLVYAGIDYLGFNLTHDSRDARIAYRVFQALMHSAISWILYDQVGLSTAVAFNIIWWSFGLDWLYCGYAELFNPGPPWDSRGVVANCWMKNQVTWAYWTPVGVARGVRRDEKIAGDTLIAQSILGLSLALTVTIAF